MVATGLATGLAIFALLKPVEGVQLYEVAPLAVNVVPEPEQIVVFPLTDTTGIGVTVTVTLAEEVQPVPFPTVTV